MTTRIPLPLRSLIAALVIGAVGLAGGVQAATVFKWTDDKGVTHYSDSPPPGKADEAERLELEATGPRPAPDRQQTEDKEEDGAPEAEDVNVTQAEIEVQKLEQKVAEARQVYEQARENRIEGEKVRKGSEQNYVRYLERIENLRNQEEAAKERLDNLRTQLEKARSRLEKLKQKKKQAQQEEGA